ncbi:MAG: prepilin peptidase [Chloroflexi bacterium]|nr:prepilin peptidase [Chloroflexota bacterium]
MLTALPLVVAVFAASIALVTDLRSRRIPNWLTVTAFLAGVVLNLIASGTQGGLSALEGAALGFGLLIPFYLLRVMGAGDVKLLAACGALLGPENLLAAAAAAALVGGILSLVILARTGTLSLALHQMFIMHVVPTSSGAKAPYAVAIASGVYLAMLPRLPILMAGG